MGSWPDAPLLPFPGGDNVPAHSCNLVTNWSSEIFRAEDLKLGREGLDFRGCSGRGMTSNMQMQMICRVAAVGG